MSVDENEEISTELAMDPSMATIQHEPAIDGIQIVDPNSRYKHPKSKLHDSDMGILGSMLENDKSI